MMSLSFRLLRPRPLPSLMNLGMLPEHACMHASWPQRERISLNSHSRRSLVWTETQREELGQPWQQERQQQLLMLCRAQAGAGSTSSGGSLPNDPFLDHPTSSSSSPKDELSTPPAARPAPPPPPPSPTLAGSVKKFVLGNILPLALLSGLAIAVLAPELGTAASKTNLQTLVVVAIFITSGLQIKRGEALQAVKSTGPCCARALYRFALFP
jgi:hypothetical protein